MLYSPEVGPRVLNSRSSRSLDLCRSKILRIKNASDLWP